MTKDDVQLIMMIVGGVILAAVVIVVFLWCAGIIGDRDSDYSYSKRRYRDLK